MSRQPASGRGLFAPSPILAGSSVRARALTFGARSATAYTLLQAPVAAPSFAGAVSDHALELHVAGTMPPLSPRRSKRRSATIRGAMLISAALVAATYIVPLAAVGLAESPPTSSPPARGLSQRVPFAGPGVFGTALVLAVVAGGMLNGTGMFNALMLSYARVPYALAKDGLLPRFLTRTHAPQRPPVRRFPGHRCWFVGLPGRWRSASPSSASSPSILSSMARRSLLEFCPPWSCSACASLPG